MGGLSQAEIDAVQASRRRKEAAGGGHPSYQGKNRGLYQQITGGTNATVDYGPGDIQFDPRASGTNIYDDRYRQAFATFERGTPLQQEEIIGRMQLGQQAAQAHRAMRGAGPLGAAAGMRPLVQRQLGTASQMGQARAQREMAQKAALGGSIRHAAQVDIAQAAAESARLQALTDFKRQAEMDEEEAEKAARAQYAIAAARGAGEVKKYYDNQQMQTYSE